MTSRRAKGRRGRQPQIHRSYTVFDAASRLDLDRATIRRWIKEGLRTLDGPRPILILGRDLLAFLKARREAAKQACLPGTMFCFRCRKPRAPALGMVDYKPDAGTAGNLSALCAVCEAPMNRRCAPGQITAVMPGLDVTWTRL